MKISKTLAFIIFIILFSTAQGDAGWVLYDNFNSGSSFNPVKWNVDDSSAVISIENGKAKFVHQPGHPDDSSRLEIVQDPETIKGIKTTVRVTSCSGDVRTQLIGFFGKRQADYIVASSEIRSESENIASAVWIVGPPPNYVYKADLFGGHFKHPADIINEDYTMSMQLSAIDAIFRVDGMGKTVYDFPAKLSATDEFPKGIGTRSNNGDGPCTVYFDDVYIYRGLTSPGINILLLDE